MNIRSQIDFFCFFNFSIFSTFWTPQRKKICARGWGQDAGPGQLTTPGDHARWSSQVTKARFLQYHLKIFSCLRKSAFLTIFFQIFLTKKLKTNIYRSSTKCTFLIHFSLTTLAIKKIEYSKPDWFFFYFKVQKI